MWRVADQVASNDVNGMKNAFVDQQGVVWVFGANLEEARQNAGNIDCLIRVSLFMAMVKVISL